MTYFCADGKHHHKSELPANVRPLLGSAYYGNYNSFNTKLKNAVRKLLPDGYSIYEWHKMYYESSCVVCDPWGRFIYLHFSDVRYWVDEWATNVLIRSMEHEKDWTGGPNHRTSLFSLTEDIKRVPYSNPPSPEV